jgi:peroxiredoxin Q/BCP
MLTPNTLAPAWSASDDQGTIYSSTSLKGQWYIVYFYPKDDTPGCTAEACGFRDGFTSLLKNITILGVSADSSESHQQFREKYQLPFPLLVDTEKTLINLFGANGTDFPKRTTFLIDDSGMIRKIYTGIDCKAHAAEIEKDRNSM